MSKETCIEKLKQENLTAYDENGIIMIGNQEGTEKEYRKFLTNLKNKIDDMEYTGSYGVRWKMCN